MARLSLAFICTFLLGSLLPLAAYGIQFEGVVYPFEERELAFTADGRVVEVLVDEGSAVEPGTLMMRLEHNVQDMESARRETIWQDRSGVQTHQARLAILNAQYQTLKRLFSQTGSVSEDELNSMRLERLQTRGQLDSSNVQEKIEHYEFQLAAEALEQRKLYAPLAGVVTKIEKKAGEWVSAGETVVHLVDLRSVVVKLNVSDSTARSLQLMQSLEVAVDGVGIRAGPVTFLSPVADPASGLVRLHITVENADLAIRPGTRARVAL
jgi:RND family efflux transporter MFP subunit